MALVLTAFAGAIAVEPVRDSDGERFFSERIEPLLKAKCLGCHSHAAGEMDPGYALAGIPG